jgi:DNA polymerase III epsilon subunit-like protein
MAIWGRRLSDTPIAVIDFETTGFSPKSGSRVVEVAVVRIDPGAEPRLVLDTLVDPDGPVHATRIHGITDDDVLGAPLFTDLAANVAQALEGAVVAAFNASFDMRFLEHELHRSKRGQQAWIPPHVCLMYARPLLNLGPKCSLADACAACGLPPASHRAADDAIAGARLWLIYRDAARKAGVECFEDLEAGRYAFMTSFESDPFTRQLVDALAPSVPDGQLKPRTTEGTDPAAPLGVSPSDRRRRYWNMLLEAISDGVVTPDEMSSLLAAQQQLNLPTEDIRALHAKLAGEIIASHVEDAVVSTREAGVLTSLFAVLRNLGWAPGDPV